LKARILNYFKKKAINYDKRAKEAIAEIQQENRKYFNRKRKVPSKYKVHEVVAITRTEAGREVSQN